MVVWQSAPQAVRRERRRTAGTSAVWPRPGGLSAVRFVLGTGCYREEPMTIETIAIILYWAAAIVAILGIGLVTVVFTQVYRTHHSPTYRMVPLPEEEP